MGSLRERLLAVVSDDEVMQKHVTFTGVAAVAAQARAADSGCPRNYTQHR